MEKELLEKFLLALEYGGDALDRAYQLEVINNRFESPYRQFDSQNLERDKVEWKRKN